MICPKCGHQQPEEDECRRCGVLFHKIAPPPPPVPAGASRAAPSESAAPEMPAPKDSPWAFPRGLLGDFVLGGLLVALALTYLFMADRRAGASPVKETAALSVKAPVDRASVIRRASDATVFIESPWGVGSGFLTDGEGHIVTNLHVVEITPPVFETLEEERKELKMFLGMTDPSRSSGGFASQDQRDRIREARDRLDKVEGILRDYWVAKRAPFLRVVANSDRSFSAVILKKSANHDLALLKVNWSDSPHVPLGGTDALSTGDQVFAIGSPMGIRRTVTSGIVSGKVTIHNEEYLQTDAPINPGNSGGPLISEAGEVVGVNTMTVANAQGLGFAIPIETVKSELGLGGGNLP